MTRSPEAAASTSDSPVLRGSQQSSGEARDQASFTAGPWRVRQTSLHPSIVSDAGPICNFGSARTYRDVTAANARLIAAAPELYEACDGALAYLEAVGHAVGVRAILREALAKARGEA